ncbi:MAG: NAD-dependent epimerase/dehydratase family protein [Dethiobacteria bacterium]
MMGFSLAKAIKFTKDLFMTAKINCVKGIINISSQSVYGNKSKPLWNEDTPVSPDSTYAMAKYATEILTHTICNQKTMIGTNIRLDSLLGPGLDARLVSRFVNQVIKHEPIKIIGGMQKLSFLDVRDASEGLISLIFYRYAKLEKYI